MSQQSQLLLRKIAFSPDVPKRLERKELLKQLNQTTIDLLLNELEVVVWAIYLENMHWGLQSETLEDFLLFSAMAVKKYMNHDTGPVQAHLETDRPGFLERYEVWHGRHKDQLNVSPKLLNKRFKELNQPIAIKGENKSVDYNLCVDEILHTTPKTAKLHRLKQLTSDQEIMNLYRAYKLNSKIIINSCREAEFQPALERLDSIVSQYPEAFVKHEPGEDSEIVTYVTPVVLDRINSQCSEFLSHDPPANFNS